MPARKSTPKSPAAGRSPRLPAANLLAGVFRSLNEGVFIANREFERTGLRIRHVNPALCRITGYTAAELVGQGHGLLHPARGDLQAMRRWARTLPRAEPFVHEGYIRGRDGADHYAHWTLSPLTDARGRVTHIIASYRDLTAQRRLQEALVHSQRLDAVGRLAGGVAHDFNNLLSVINGYCEILHESVGADPKARKELNEIHQAGQRAAALVRQLLAFSRRQALDPRVIEPNRLVRENASILGRLLGPERSLEIALGETVTNIRVDPTQLQQVLLNLVLNARDATTANGRVVVSTGMRRVELGRNRRITDPAPGLYVVLTVTDNGCGMDAETQKLLFEPFFTTKGEGGGTGLGLALVYGVVQQSGGHVSVRSRPGAGSSFEIHLPAVDEPAAPTLGTLAPLPVTRGRETLLVVEDDDVVRKMVAGILGADGYEVIAAPTAASALREMRRVGKAVHLVVADHTERSGEVVRLVRTLHRSQAGLRMLSTPSHEGEPFSGLPPHRHRLLPKPFALCTLLEMVRHLLDADD